MALGDAICLLTTDKYFIAAQVQRPWSLVSACPLSLSGVDTEQSSNVVDWVIDWILKGGCGKSLT